MKKIVAILLVMLMAVAAVACQAKDEPKAENEPAAEAPQEAAEQPALGGNVAGGWTPAADFSLTEERQAIFDKGMAALLGVDYEALAYLGSQVVAGRNHVFLVKGTAVTPSLPVSYALAYLYEDLQGEVKILTVADLPIVPQEDGTLGPVEDGLMGGWKYAESPAMTEEAEAAFRKALEGMVGAGYVDVAYLGEQVVSGLNRCILCQVTPVVPDAQPHYALVYVNEDAQGAASLARVIDLDIGALCEYGE